MCKGKGQTLNQHLIFLYRKLSWAWGSLFPLCLLSFVVFQLSQKLLLCSLFPTVFYIDVSPAKSL